MGSWYVMWWRLTHRYQQLGGTWHFHLQGYGERTHTLKRELAGSSKLYLMESHPVTILNKLKSPLHITCLGLIYMSTRVIKLHTEFLERYAVSFSPQNTWSCPNL
jgi:hypothetical protein